MQNELDKFEYLGGRGELKFNIENIPDDKSGAQMGSFDQTS
jgi:hypothetical protein